MTARLTARAAMLLAGTIVVGSCVRGAAADAQAHAPDAAATAALTQADDAAHAALLHATAQPIELAPGALATVATAPVHGRTGPGGAPFETARRTVGAASGHARRFGTRTLDIALRSRASDLAQYPCTSCHAGTKLVPGRDRVADAHRDIQPVHPAETGAACRTCHAAENVEELTLQSDERATFDDAYRLCAQCHFPQAEAWAGGAHGKRLDGWQGRRVVLGCADCHDPHEPATRQRIPFRPPRLHRAGSREP